MPNQEIFPPEITLDTVNSFNKNTLMSHLDIEYTEIGKDYLKAKMPVDSRHHQPMGILHGGASVVLAETVASQAANMAVDYNKYYCVGLDINANHIRAVKSGVVFATARPVHLGRRTHVWEIKIENEEQKLVNISRLTVAVIER